MTGRQMLLWLAFMARLALIVLEFWMMLFAACARTAQEVREWKPATGEDHLR